MQYKIKIENLKEYSKEKEEKSSGTVILIWIFRVRVPMTLNSMRRLDGQIQRRDPSLRGLRSWSVFRRGRGGCISRIISRRGRTRI